jgi:hypothetical protein
MTDYQELTAPCGLDCFNCTFYLAPDNPEAMAQLKKWSEEYQVPLEHMECRGCRHHDGKIPLQMHLYGESHHCAAYDCVKEKGHHHCGECDDFPCDSLHPYADRADILPHNTKVFNLCLINKMGLEKWAESKAQKVRETYFTMPWSLER